MKLIPCRLRQVVFDEQTDSQTLFIGEIGGERTFPIVVGPLEAIAIDRAVKGQPFQRPLTHDLFANTLETLGSRIVEVHINDCREGTYFADLVLEQADGKRISIDSRPSDAIAMQVRAQGATLLVADELLGDE
jgi:bifunctional DNase/RNase